MGMSTLKEGKDVNLPNAIPDPWLDPTERKNTLREAAESVDKTVIQMIG